MSGAPTLTPSQGFVLGWLGGEDASLYGECRGPDLDALIRLGLAKTAQRPTDWSAVTLTDKGRATLAEGLN